MHSPEFSKLLEENRRLSIQAERICLEVRQRIKHLEWFVDAVRHEWQPKSFASLRAAIRVVQGCDSRHLTSFDVNQFGNERFLWSGVVEEFVLIGAAGAATCYAWHYAEEGQEQTFVLPKQGAVDSPEAAAQLFLLAKNASPAADVV